jgi:xylulokinase
MSQLFLGLDCSTQSLTGIIIDYNSRKVIYKHVLNYDVDLKHYNTTNGAYFSQDGKTVHSNPLMWAEALDLLLKDLMHEVEVKDIKCISGSGQQHGTVYLNQNFYKQLKSLDSYLSLNVQLKDVFSRKTSPIWMDSSTEIQCKEIREQLGGKEQTIKLTGSNTFERFSGPQIRKFYQNEPQKYSDTMVIHLVSSFLASLFIGKNAPIDYGDGAGMNLMNITTKEWDKRALDATAPGLKEKLPLLTSPVSIIGEISPFIVQRFGFLEGTKVVAFSGDNPNSLIGTGVTSKNKAAISLGTSDTFFGYLEELTLDMTGESHIFVAPTGDYMSLICFKNGSLAREKIKDQYNLSWEQFSKLLKSSLPGNNGKLMLPYFYPEIVPLVLNPGVSRFGFDEKDVEGNVRAIIEAQFLSMRLHSRWMGKIPIEIHATGGASANQEILQVAANIFNAKIIIFDISNSAALGAAIRATKSFPENSNDSLTWGRLIESILKKKVTLRPQKAVIELYDDLLKLYHEYEEFVLYGKENPEKNRLNFIHKHFSEN